MKFRCLGRTGLEVSEIGLGTAELGMEYGIADERGIRRLSKTEAAQFLNCALDMGINFIDTARVYGVSEEIIGGALKSRRKEYTLASKIAGREDGDKGGGTLRAHVMASVQESLQALQTDVIDLMQLHSASLEDIRCGEQTEVLQELQAAGSIRFLGASTYGEEAALAALEDGRFDCVQIAYNVLDRELENRVLPLAQSKGVGVVVRSVLLKGALTHRYSYLPPGLEELKSAVERIRSIGARGSVSLPEFAYRFVMAHPAVSTALVGTVDVEELKAAIGYCAIGPLPSLWVAEARQVELQDRKQLNPFYWPPQ
jgi:aryl-alcohol dehydrogenase-like predicted oxidoreductase